MDTDSVDNETFDAPNADDLDAEVKSNIIFRKCGDLKKDSGKPQSRECDDLIGNSLKKCVGPTAQDCSNSFKIWSRLVLGSFYGILKANQVMVDFKPSDIFFDETSVTVVGIDNREGQESKKDKTVADISKVIIEILMKKKFTEADYKKHEAKHWHEIKFNNVEEL